MSNVSDERLLGLCADLYSSQNPSATLDEGRAMARELAEFRKGLRQRRQRLVDFIASMPEDLTPDPVDLPPLI